MTTRKGESRTGADIWSSAQAKARLSEVIENARTRGPQTITRNRLRVAIVVDAEEWDRVTRRGGSLSDFFKASPLRGSGLKLRRLKDQPRSSSS